MSSEKEFTSYAEVAAHGGFPFKLVTTNGYSTYTGVFANKDDVVRRRVAIEDALKTHKKLKPVKPTG